MLHPQISRRLLLKQGGVALAAFGAGSWWGPSFLRRTALAADAARRGASKGAGGKVLICIFQRGAADGLSMVVPHGDPSYYRHRDDIAIPRPAKANDGAALDLDGFFGLHPQMAALLPLYKAGHLAAVHACGSPNASRSHFDMQDFMESGTSDDKGVASGWVNRMLVGRPRARDKHSPFRAVAMSSVVPRTLQGGVVDALAIPDFKSFGVGGAGGAASGIAAGFEGMYEQAVGDVLHGAARESFEAIDLLRKADPSKYQPAKGVKYPDGLYGRALLQVAQLIKAGVGLEVAFVETDGWDTHVNQGGPVGPLAGRLHDLSHGIAALYSDLGDRMADVLVLTMSEFGRAARQNGNRGTDHGHGTCFFAVGGNVKGGRVLGEWPGLAPERLFEQRDLAVTTDFRDVFAEAAVRHFGLPVEALAKVFPNHQADAKNFRGFCNT
jgi:uncharacterized protein (DUF1501 family)